MMTFGNYFNSNNSVKSKSQTFKGIKVVTFLNFPQFNPLG